MKMMVMMIMIINFNNNNNKSNNNNNNDNRGDFLLFFRQNDLHWGWTYLHVTGVVHL